MDALILLLPVLLLLWLVLRGRKQQRAVSDMQSTLAVGQRVMTTSGLYARIVEVGDTTIDLEVADGVRTTWARAAVARKVEDAAAADPAEQTAASATSTHTAPGTATADGGATGGLAEAPERPER